MTLRNPPLPCFVTSSAPLPFTSSPTTNRFYYPVCSQTPPSPSPNPSTPPPTPPPTSQTVKTLLDNLYATLTSASTSTTSITNDTPIPRLVSDIESQVPLIDIQQTPTLIKGTWRTVITSRPSSASILQRTLLQLAPTVDQLIVGATNDALESAPKYIITRVDLRKLLGTVLNIKANITSIDKNRIGIRFDDGWFVFFNGKLKLPYPVPFKLLGKKACGWQDITVLTDRFRIVRGNRGSCFILRKVIEGDEDADIFPITNDILEACSD